MRLTSETYANSADASANYIAAYSFDLSSNRMSKTAEHAASTSDIDTFNAGGTFTADETDTYTYDADDRLLTEKDEKSNPDDDTFTVYSWGDSNNWTMQKKKDVYSGLTATGTPATTTYGYDDQGRMTSIMTATTTTTFNYGPDGTRIRQIIDDGTTTTNILYLVDTNNPTGYSQTLEECTFDGMLWTKKTYTLGLDVISQYDTANPDNGTLTFVYDGHGSTRALMNAMAAVIQRFAYDAFGNQLNASNLKSASAALTSLLYSGEQTDPSGMQFLRARYYDPNVARFTQFDAFRGSNGNPISLHKYLYASGNPVAGIDPRGTFTLAQTIGVVTIGAVVIAIASVSIHVDYRHPRAVSAGLAGIAVAGYIPHGAFQLGPHPIPAAGIAPARDGFEVYYDLGGFTLPAGHHLAVVQSIRTDDFGLSRSGAMDMAPDNYVAIHNSNITTRGGIPPVDELDSYYGTRRRPLIAYTDSTRAWWDGPDIGSSAIFYMSVTAIDVEDGPLGVGTWGGPKRVVAGSHGYTVLNSIHFTFFPDGTTYTPGGAAVPGGPLVGVPAQGLDADWIYAQTLWDEEAGK